MGFQEPTLEQVQKLAEQLVLAGFSDADAYRAIDQILYKPLEPIEFAKALEPEAGFRMVLGPGGDIISFDPHEWKRIEWWGRRIRGLSAVGILDFVASVDRSTMPFKPPH